MLPPARDIPRREHAVDTRPDERRNAGEARRIEAPYARAGVVSAVPATSVANRGTSLANAAARRVGNIRAVRETDGAAGEPHRTPRGDQ
ncbi:hypothetical protein MTO96_033083 [Rhipicephalus appendiculatus]